MPIGYIVWPQDGRDARLLYLRFILPIAERLALPFSPRLPDPLASARGFIAGTVSAEDLEAEKLRWWDVVDDGGRGDRSREALAARVAICLLSAGPNDPAHLGDELSWFFELMHMLQVDTQSTIDRMYAYFTFRKK